MLSNSASPHLQSPEIVPVPDFTEEGSKAETLVEVLSILPISSQ